MDSRSNSIFSLRADTDRYVYKDKKKCSNCTASTKLDAKLQISEEAICVESGTVDYLSIRNAVYLTKPAQICIIWQYLGFVS